MRWTERMREASGRMVLTALKFDDPGLRHLMLRLARNYRERLRAIARVNNSVVNGDLQAGQRALDDLNEIANDAIPLVGQLQDKYPDL
jgi:hypothetical protein